MVQCHDEDDPILPGFQNDIKYLSIEQNSSSYSVIANGTNTIQFSIVAYDAKKKLIAKYKTSAFSQLKLEINGSEELSYPFTFTTTTSGKYAFVIKDLSKEKSIIQRIIINAIPEESFEPMALPIIFHYISTDLLSLSEIQALQQQLNTALEVTNKAYANLQGSLSPNAANSNIQFYLAGKDPDGNTLDFIGLDTIRTSINSFGTLENSNVSDFIWDGHFWKPSQYINVWIVTLDDNFSWAKFPEFTSSINGFPTNTYGVVFNKNHLSDPLLLAHELGHMLNLNHVFDNSCTDMDGCTDTWWYKRVYNDFTTNWMLERYTCENIRFTADNIMDYYPTLNNTFTLQQVKKMQAVLSFCPYIPTPQNIANGGRSGYSAYSKLSMKGWDDPLKRIP